MTTTEASRDWLASTSSNLLAWWLPHAALLVGLFVPIPVRVVIWTVALLWMGTACILNVRRCGRTHCRYTGPYYLAMIVPVLALASFRQVFTSGLRWECHRRRKQTDMVGDRARMGQILVGNGILLIAFHPVLA